MQNHQDLENRWIPHTKHDFSIEEQSSNRNSDYDPTITSTITVCLVKPRNVYPKKGQSISQFSTNLIKFDCETSNTVYVNNSQVCSCNWTNQYWAMSIKFLAQVNNGRLWLGWNELEPDRHPLIASQVHLSTCHSKKWAL